MSHWSSLVNNIANGVKYIIKMLFFELNLHYFYNKKGFKISFKTLKRDTNKERKNVLHLRKIPSYTKICATALQKS